MPGATWLSKAEIVECIAPNGPQRLKLPNVSHFWAVRVAPQADHTMGGGGGGPRRRAGRAYIHLPTYRPTYGPSYLPTYLPTYLRTYLSPTYLPTYLPAYLPTYLPAHART